MSWSWFAERHVVLGGVLKGLRSFEGHASVNVSVKNFSKVAMNESTQIPKLGYNLF